MLLLLTVVLGAFVLWWLTCPPKRLWELGNKIPGQRVYPIVGNIFNNPVTGPAAIPYFMDAVKKYGTTIRYWIGSQLHVMVSEPEDIQMILSSQSLITKSDSYNAFHSWLGTGLLVSTGDLWQRRRKAITPTFHFKILEQFVPTFNKCARTLVECLEKEVDKGSFIITEYVSNCALDAVAETAMGTQINAQANPLDKYPVSIFRMTKYLIEKICNPFLAVEPFYTLSGRKKKESDTLKIVFSLPNEMLQKKKNEKIHTNSPSSEEEAFGAKKKTAFLELLLEMQQNKVPAFQTDQDINDEVMTFMFEGHDTTTMALSYTIWLLGMHPEIQDEVYREIKDIIGDNEPSLEDYQKMQVLERVIKESLRLYPPVPGIGRQINQDIVLPASGLVVPAGSQVDVYIFLVHRNAEYFPEPERFNPDRFLEPQKHPFCYVPFSAGPRNCIGQKFAMLDLKAILSSVILNYKVQSDGDLILNPELLLRTVKGPNVSLTLRN